MYQPNKFSALERLQLFKPVASIGVLRAALIEESALKGAPLSADPSPEAVVTFAHDIGFRKCASEECDLWYNHRKGWFMTHDEKAICRMCAIDAGLDPEF